MGQGHAPGAAGQAAKTATAFGEGDSTQADALRQFRAGARDKPDREGEGRRRRALARIAEDEGQGADDQRGQARPPQPLQHAVQIATLPGQQRPRWQDHHQRRAQGADDKIVIGRAHRDRAAERLGDDRIERAEQHRNRHRRQQQIIEQ